MGQEVGEKWTAAAKLQPTFPKPDRLLGEDGRVFEFKPMASPAEGAAWRPCARMLAWHRASVHRGEGLRDSGALVRART